MSTIGSIRLLREERDLLDRLCQIRAQRIAEAEREAELYMQGERRVEAMNEAIDAKLCEACRTLGLGESVLTIDMVDKLIMCARTRVECEPKP